MRYYQAITSKLELLLIYKSRMDSAAARDNGQHYSEASNLLKETVEEIQTLINTTMSGYER